MTVDASHGIRRRITGALFVGNAIASTAYLTVIPVAALAAQELTGGARWAGLPNAAGTIGAALSATLLSAWSARVGRRTAFTAGFLVSALGAALAALSLSVASFALLLIGMAIFGVGRTVGQLSRYAAGDLWPADRRSSAIGLVVWAGTIGSVLGPLLIGPASRWSIRHLDVELAGPFAVAAFGSAVAVIWYLVMLRPEPLTLAVVESTAARGEDASGVAALRPLLRRPTVQLALVAMMVSQLVMVLVMTMTPLHIRHHHHGLALVSGIMIVHTLGMYAFSPLSGVLVGRFGGRRVIGLGVALLVVASLLGAAADQAQAGVLALSLLVLGVGWNFAFVAGSVVLLEGLTLGQRLRVQGVADAWTWISGGVAALASGFVLSLRSFGGLAILAAGLSLVPLVALYRERRAAASSAGEAAPEPGVGKTT